MEEMEETDRTVAVVLRAVEEKLDTLTILSDGTEDLETAVDGTDALLEVGTVV